MPNSWVPHSNCFTSSISRLHPRLRTGWSSVPLWMQEVWMHPCWMWGVWSLLQWAQYLSQTESHNAAVRTRPELKPKREKALVLMHLICCNQGLIPSLFYNQQNHQRKEAHMLTHSLLSCLLVYVSLLVNTLNRLKNPHFETTRMFVNTGLLLIWWRLGQI